MKTPRPYPLFIYIMVTAVVIVITISIIALYMDIIKLPDSGSSAKLDYSELRKLFFHAGSISVAGGILVVALASSIFFRLSQPYLRKLEQQAESFKVIANTAHESIFLVDPDGIIRYANPAASSLFGYTVKEMAGENIKMLMPPQFREKDDHSIASFLQTGIKQMIGRRHQLTAQRKDGSRFPLSLVVAEIRLKHTHLYAGVIHDLSIQQKLQREIFEIPERERLRIGEELHDGLGQQLTGLSMLAESLLNKASRPEHELASQLASGLYEALTQVRAMSRGLMPIQIDADGFEISLQEITESIEQQSHIPIKLHVDDRVQIANDSTATHLYRIVQESLNNAVKHASASQINVSLVKEQDNGLLEVTDDGIGIPVDLENSPGLGLNIMRHRCGLFDGEITINPAGKRGTRVRCRFPINPADVTPAKEPPLQEPR